MDSVHMVFGKLGNHTPVKAVADKASSNKATNKAATIKEAKAATDMQGSCRQV